MMLRSCRQLTRNVRLFSTSATVNCTTNKSKDREKEKSHKKLLGIVDREELNTKDTNLLAGHPPNSNHLSYSDPIIGVQEHPRDIKLLDALKTEEVKQGPRPDKLYKTIELEAVAYEPAVLDSYEWFVVTAASHLGIPVGLRWRPEKSDKWRFPLLRSVFVHKRHQDHYEIRTYHWFCHLHRLTGSTADTFLEYIERNLPEGVGLKVTKFELMRMPEHLVPPSTSEAINPPTSSTLSTPRITAEGVSSASINNSP